MRRFAVGFVFGLVALPLLLLAIARLGGFAVNATATPSRLEASLAQMALASAAARHAPHLTNPVAPTETNLLAGMRLFKNDCAGCHGTPNTAHANETNVNLYPNAQQFALHPPRKPPWQLFWLIRGGIRYSGMFAWAGQFAPDSTGRDVSDEKIWTAVTFLTHLDSLPPAVDSEWHRKAGH